MLVLSQVERDTVVFFAQKSRPKAMALGNYPWQSTKPGRSRVFDWISCVESQAIPQEILEDGGWFFFSVLEVVRLNLWMFKKNVVSLKV